MERSGCSRASSPTSRRRRRSTARSRRASASGRAAARSSPRKRDAFEERGEQNMSEQAFGGSQGLPDGHEDGTATETIKPGYLVKGVTSIAKQTHSSSEVPEGVRARARRARRGHRQHAPGLGHGSAFYASGDRSRSACSSRATRPRVRRVGSEHRRRRHCSSRPVTAPSPKASTTPIARALETVGAVTRRDGVRVMSSCKRAPARRWRVPFKRRLRRVMEQQSLRNRRSRTCSTATAGGRPRC
jgi:hypothetical protein